jgi:hypothetical protein
LDGLTRAAILFLGWADAIAAEISDGFLEEVRATQACTAYYRSLQIIADHRRPFQLLQPVVK